MKTISSLSVPAAAVLAWGLATGCKPAQEAGDGAAVPSAPERSITQTIQETGEAAKQAVADAGAQAQELITKAQGLVNEKKYEDAMKLLNDLKNFKLTPEQEKLVRDLQASIQKTLQSQAVSEGAKAVGGALGGQKP